MLNTLVNNLKLLIKDPRNAFYYFQGNIRYSFYYKKSLRDLLFSKRFQAAIEKRYLLAFPRCLETGQCIECGCDMPELLFATKGCKAGCYPSLPITKKEFNELDRNN